MKYNCDKFEEIIWEHARTGVELSAEAQAHLAQCQECRQTLRDAKLILGAVLEADCIPYAPDCRQAVLDRITPRKRAPRLAWAYAFSGAVFAGISALALINVFTHVSPEMPSAKMQAPRAAIKQSLKQAKPTPAIDSRKVGFPTVTAKFVKPQKHYRVRVAHETLKPQPQPYMVAELPSSPPPVGTESVRTYDGSATHPPASYSFHYDSFKETTDGAIGTDLNKLSADKSDISRSADNLTIHYADASVDRKTDAAGADFKGDSTDAFDEITPSFKKDASVISANALGKPATTGLHLSAAAEEGNSRFQYKSVYSSPATEKPVALAVAHWSNAQDDSAVNYSYSYSDKDPATGEVTECSVKRTGDCVEIILESKPEEKDPSRRGSTDYEILAKI